MEIKRLCILSCHSNSHNYANHTVNHNNPDEKETKFRYHPFNFFQYKALNLGSSCTYWDSIQIEMLCCPGIDRFDCSVLKIYCVVLDCKLLEMKSTALFGKICQLFSSFVDYNKD